MEEDTKTKQIFLREQILDKGYDPEAFVDFLNSKREDGSDISSWTLQELVDLVSEYVDMCESNKTSEKSADTATSPAKTESKLDTSETRSSANTTASVLAPSLGITQNLTKSQPAQQILTHTAQRTAQSTNRDSRSRRCCWHSQKKKKRR